MSAPEPWDSRDVAAALRHALEVERERAYAAGFEAGHWHGVAWQRAYETHVQDLAAWAASTPPYAVLADRRGDHERAEAQRRTLAERDIWPPTTSGRVA